MSNNVYKVDFPVIWMIISLVLFYILQEPSSINHDLFTSLASVSYILTIYNWLSKGNRPFSLFCLFVVYALFSNLGQSILYMFTRQDFILNIYSKYDLQDICPMLRYQFVCASGLYLGSAIYLRKSYRNVTAESISVHYRYLELQETSISQKFFDILLYVCLAVVFYFTIYQLVLRQTMSYKELYNERELVSAYFAFGTIVLGLNAILKKRHVRLVLFSWLFYFLAYNVAGTRSMGIIYAGALLFSMPILFPYYFQKRFYFVWGIVALLGISAISIISNLRTQSIGSLSNETDLWLSVLQSINEMGISETPTLITMDAVDNGTPYMQSILFNILLGFFPSSLLEGLVPETWTTQLGQWATVISNTTTVEWGYSWIAESYINYGELGWIFTAVYGYFIAFAENYSLRKIKNGDYLLALCLIAILCKQIFFARAQINLVMSFYKPCIYILYLWLLFGDRVRNKLKI